MSNEWEEWDCSASWCGNIDDFKSVPQDKECPFCNSDQIVYHTDNYYMTKYMMCMECDSKWAPRVKTYRRKYSGFKF
jgi:hypothetical protein